MFQQISFEIDDPLLFSPKTKVKRKVSRQHDYSLECTSNLKRKQNRDKVKRKLSRQHDFTDEI